MLHYPNAAIKLHDSRVGSVRWVENAVQIWLQPAYVHKSLGRPGIDPGIGCLQNCVIEMRDAQLEGDFGSLPEDVMDGRLQAGPEACRNLLSLPWENRGVMALALTLSPGKQSVKISGSEIRVFAAGGTVYIEDFQP